ncbi:MAG: MipA/OmpV family protein [Gammaproteobacteria bacterium]|nr:MipA/OmpV family protein [Gammaproteobacteria bacterium]
MILFITSLFFQGYALADSEVSRIPILDAPPGTVGLGVGVRLETTPYKEDESSSGIGDDINQDWVPMYLYEGKYLFAHGTSVGVHMYRNDFFSADALARYRFDQLDPQTSDFYEGMEKREQTVDAGFSFSFKGAFGSVKFEWVTDTLNKHNGEEVDVTYRYRLDEGRWIYSPFFSVIYQDGQLSNYYFGVSEAEARPGRPAYEPGSGAFARIGLNTSYQLTRRWLLYANIAFEGMDTGQRESPLVEEDYLAAVFMGASYLFGDIYVADVADLKRKKEWSWRINYGYNAKEIFNHTIRGDLRPDNEIDTEVLGFTFGKLVTGGPRIDVYGRLALFRRLEEPFQDDFWDYVAYVMVMGKGYKPWSDQLAFRWGVGYGVSYAEEAPAAEKIEQAEKGRDTSRFLNYLEMQVDFPVDNLVKTKSLRNCFVGMTVAHRSGLFGSSDLFNNVSGGSNAITGHLECLR